MKLKFKGYILGGIATCLLSLSLMGCGSEAVSKEIVAFQNDGEISVVTTIFPIYDWAKNIADGVEGVSITLLNDTGADPHSFQSSARDIMDIASSDLFIYVGGQSDTWAEDAVNSSKGINALRLMDELGDRARYLELSEALKSPHAHAHLDEPDEHVWLSLRNAQIFCDKIAQRLIAIDKENEESYLSNLESYKKSLAQLDEEYARMLEEKEARELIFGDRFPFLYFVSDYGLDYYAAFLGCNAESEASFDVVSFLSQKINELKPKAIFTIEKSDQKIARAIIENSKEKETEIKSLNSIQAVSKEEIQNGASYIEFMASNLELLREWL